LALGALLEYKPFARKENTAQKKEAQVKPMLAQIAPLVTTAQRELNTSYSFPAQSVLTAQEVLAFR